MRQGKMIGGYIYKQKRRRPMGTFVVGMKLESGKRVCRSFGRGSGATQLRPDYGFVRFW